MDRPRFLAYTEEDHAQARSIPYVADLIDWVAYEQQEAQRAVMYLLRADAIPQAKQALAKHDAMGEFVARFWMKDPAPPEQEEQFVDPALPESARE